VGIALASLAVPADRLEMSGVIGVAVVGLFAVLVSGRFFSGLSSSHAIALFLALLLCWVPECAPLRKMWPGWRGLLRVGLTAVPVSLVLWAIVPKLLVEEEPPPRAVQPTATVEPVVPPPSASDYEHLKTTGKFVSDPP
jgi:hypothetical protein